MDHSRNTKLNDAVTYRQFSRFLVHAQIPPSWKQEVICLEDVLHMPVIFQDKLFSDWISQYLKKDDNCVLNVLIYKLRFYNPHKLPLTLSPQDVRKHPVSA